MHGLSGLLESSKYLTEPGQHVGRLGALLVGDTRPEVADQPCDLSAEIAELFDLDLPGEGDS